MPSKKKIVLTVTNDLSFDQRMDRICTSLHNAGYVVLLVGRRLKHSRVLVEKPYAQKRLKCFYNKGKLFYAEYNLRLFFYLMFSMSFDAVCAIDLDTILPAFFAARIKGKKIVYDAHEYFTEVPEVIDRPAVKKVWEKVAAFTIPKVSHAYT